MPDSTREVVLNDRTEKNVELYPLEVFLRTRPDRALFDELSRRLVARDASTLIRVTVEVEEPTDG